MRKLSYLQRKMLIRHIDGPIEVDRRAGTADGLTFYSLIRAKLLRYGPGYNYPFSKFSVLTVTGRQTVAAILADYAETLVTVGIASKELPVRPLDVPKAIKGKKPELTDIYPETISSAEQVELVPNKK
jgi:hypothetical protein